jgi:4'-phosphopantetheinyl transferase EntD
VLTSPFPDWVAFESVTEPDLEGFVPHPDEAAAVSERAVASRHRDFRLGRLAARRALLRVRGDAPPVRRAEDGRPLWPNDVVGSISHSGGLAVAAVAPRARCAGIGVDVEQLSRTLKTDITPRVCTERELPWVRAGEGNDRLLMLFAAKEVVFKCLYPIERVYLDFHAADLRWLPEAEAFEVELLADAAADYPAGARFTVGCRRIGGYAFAYAALAEASS